MTNNALYKDTLLFILCVYLRKFVNKVCLITVWLPLWLSFWAFFMWKTCSYSIKYLLVQYVVLFVLKSWILVWWGFFFPLCFFCNWYCSTLVKYLFLVAWALQYWRFTHMSLSNRSLFICQNSSWKQSCYVIYSIKCWLWVIVLTKCSISTWRCS